MAGGLPRRRSRLNARSSKLIITSSILAESRQDFVYIHYASETSE
jgi:hypothetical protein